MVRTPAAPIFKIRPVTSVSPDWYFLGVRPKCAPTARDERKRPGSSIAEGKVRDTTAPPDGAGRAKASWVVDSRGEGQSHQRTDPRRSHQAAHLGVRTGQSQKLVLD